jgi:hypothetical protein
VDLPGWTLFDVDRKEWEPFLEAEETGGSKLAVGIARKTGPRIVVFGHDIAPWVMRMSLLDAISYASHGKLDIGLDRFIQVDIDDVFVGQTGTRFVPDDISALIQTQKELRHFIDNFTFTLGFSGYFFRHGDELENRGDEALVASASHFHWFPHMWRHNHAHETDGEYLTAIMIQNKLFANNTNLPTKLQCDCTSTLGCLSHLRATLRCVAYSVGCACDFHGRVSPFETRL